MTTIVYLAWMAGFVPLEATDGPAAENRQGATFADLDRDGHADFVSSAATIWWGRGDGTFSQGPDCGPGGAAPVVADFDNDGNVDVLRVRDEPIVCWGDGARGFTEDAAAVSPSPQAGEHQDGGTLAYAAASADFDGDGWLDLYMTQYEDSTTGSFVPFPDLYYINDGTGRLELVAETKKYQARGVAIADYDDDGDPDVYVSNYRLNPNMLWANDGTGNIKEVAEELNAQASWGHTISSGFGDINGDGAIDIMVGNFAHPGQPSIALLINDLADSGTFVDVGDSHGIAWQESYAGVAVQDYDNDGDLDTFLTTVYAGDFGRLYRNRGDGWHDDVTAEEGLSDQHQGYSVSWADVDEDGVLDLYLAGHQPGHLFIGEDQGNHWLRVDLRGDGEDVNGSAVGARVTIRTDALLLVRELQAGGNGGDRGASEPIVHFGLADHGEPVEVEVRWPWAKTCVYSSDADRRLDITYNPGDPECQEAEEPETGTGTTDETGTTTTATEAPGTTTGDGSTSAGEADAGSQSSDTGCSCRGAGSPGSIAIAPLLVLLARRRRS